MYMVAAHTKNCPPVKVAFTFQFARLRKLRNSKVPQPRSIGVQGFLSSWMNLRFSKKKRTREFSILLRIPNLEIFRNTPILTQNT